MDLKKCLLGLAVLGGLSACQSVSNEEYLVVAGLGIQDDAEWNKVVQTLVDRHHAKVVTYDGQLVSLMPAFKQYKPRYVALVEKPEQVGKKYVMELNRLSRQVDSDIYADFLWGIITGYNADAARRMVDHAAEPLVVKNAMATITELESAKWFDRYAWIDDHREGVWGEKTSPSDTVAYHQMPLTPTKMRNGKMRDRANSQEVMQKFYDLYTAYNPDLIVTAAHATERNLEMPFSLGNVKPKDGKLYMDMKEAPKFLQQNGKRKIYLPIGNCLIGNVNNTKESMAIAWMNDANAATFVGYVVPTWYGRNGWGGLKYWLTTPGRYTAAEAFYLNQQDMLYQLNRWSPSLATMEFPFDEKDYMGAGEKMVKDSIHAECTIHHLGFFHDRDVLAYYGDPKWNVRLQELENEKDFNVKSVIKGKQCIVTIETKADFSLERMQGNHFKEEHVLELPFNYFFPQRLNNPRLAKGQHWEVALDENFLMVYNTSFEPGRTYEIVLDID